MTVFENSVILFIVIFTLVLVLIFLIGKSIIFQPVPSDNVYSRTPEGISYRKYSKNSDCCLLVSHGNAGNIDLWKNPFEGLAYDVCIYDYFNYGSSKKTLGGIYTMSDSDLVEAGRSVLQVLLKQEYREIIFVGISLGSYPATSLASTYGGRLVLVVPFDHMSSLIPFGLWRLYGSFDNLTPNIVDPVLLVRAEKDELIPSACCDRLHAKMSNSEILTLPGGHNEFRSTLLNRKISEFIHRKKR